MTSYTEDWNSLRNYTVPEWYKDAKFGIWPTWGVYSVPAHRGSHAAEWYGRWMYTTDENTDPRGFDKARYHHYEKYGNPREFGYKEFVPLFKAERWNPDEWAEMAVDAGAKFFCMMGAHHDSFALHHSKYTRWNAVDMGPKRDLVQEMASAVRRKELKFGISNHLAWNAEFFRFNHENKFDAVDPATHDLYSAGVFDEHYLQRWWNRTIEMVDLFEPDLYYFDWGWNTDFFAERRPQFAAYYYNKALQVGKGVYGNPGVVLNYKNESLQEGCGVLDLERESLPRIRPMVWQTDTSISRNSWGYAEDDAYRTGEELIHALIDIVSKNGVLMLNFGPRADGTVPEEYRTPLMEMGAWLRICGEAIYETRPYTTYGEGEGKRSDPAQDHADEFTYSSDVVRFTRSKDSSVLYAILLGWPGRSKTIGTLKSGAFDKRIDSIRLLGTTETLEWSQDDGGLHVTMPKEKPYEYAYPLQIRLL